MFIFIVELYFLNCEIFVYYLVVYLELYPGGCIVWACHRVVSGLYAIVSS